MVGEQPEVTDVIECSLKMDTTMRAFEQEGGAKMFEKNLATGLGISKNNVQVEEVRPGSVIVDYDILIDKNTPSREQIEIKQD